MSGPASEEVADAGALRARGVGLRLRNVDVLDDVDLSFAAGRCTALLGPNGAGKSCLLALLAGDVAPSRGRVRLGGHTPHRMAAVDLAGLRAMLVQRNALGHPFTVDRVVELGFPDAPRALRGLILAELGIEDLADRVYTELSGGEQRLVQYARVLLQCEGLVAPGWLLLDEPESHLDLGVVQRVMRAARRRAERGLGVIAAIHDLELASRWADDVVVLSAGRVRATGAPREALSAALLSEIWATPLDVEAEETGGGVRIRIAGQRAPAAGEDTSPDPHEAEPEEAEPE